MEIGNLFVNHLPSSMNFMPSFRFIGNPPSPYVDLITSFKMAVNLFIKCITAMVIYDLL